MSAVAIVGFELEEQGTWCGAPADEFGQPLGAARCCWDAQTENWALSERGLAILIFSAPLNFRNGSSLRARLPGRPLAVRKLYGSSALVNLCHPFS